MASIQSKRSKTGRKTYYVVVSVAGKHKWLKAGSVSEAKALKRQIESLDHSKRVEKLGLTPKDKRIDDAFKAYLDYVRLRTAPSTLKRYRYALNTFLIFLRLFQPSVRTLSQISPEIIESYQKHRLESEELKRAADGDNLYSRKRKLLPRPQTVNHEVGTLRSAFIWAHDREMISSVPTRKVKPLKPSHKATPRLLTLDECKLLLYTADRFAKSDRRLTVHALAFRFLLNSGLRSGELCNLTWTDVDLETGLVKIQPKEGWTPKSYSREFFLNQTCLDILIGMDPSEGYIFKNLAGKQLDTDDLRQALIRVAREAGIKKLTRVHDLRHTFNSIMQMNGVDPATMGKILGHKDIETTMIYTHQTQEHLKKSIARINL